MLWTWLSPNLEFATVFIGVIAVAFLGLNLWQAATAIIIGTALGSLSHGMLSSWGPKFGVPMMVESRGAFGFLGNIMPAALNGLTASFGWFIVNSVSGAFAIRLSCRPWIVPFLGGFSGRRRRSSRDRNAGTQPHSVIRTVGAASAGCRFRDRLRLYLCEWQLRLQPTVDTGWLAARLHGMFRLLHAAGTHSRPTTRATCRQPLIAGWSESGLA